MKKNYIQINQTKNDYSERVKIQIVVITKFQDNIYDNNSNSRNNIDDY